MVTLPYAQPIVPQDIQRLVLLVSPSLCDRSDARAAEEGIAYKCLQQLAQTPSEKERYCWLIFTEQSEQTVTYLRHQFSQLSFGETSRLDRFDSAVQLYEMVLDIAKNPLNRSHRVICDCTGGGKTMSIAMALACAHHTLVSQADTELVLTHSGLWEGAPPSMNTVLFRPFDLTPVIAEEQRQYVRRQEQTAHLHFLARIAPILAHEIKNPLSLIGTDLYQLQERISDAKSQELISEIDRSVHQIDTIIRQVQQAVRQESALPAADPILLSEILQRLKLRTAKSWPHISLAIKGTLDGLYLPIALEKIYAIFTNLIDNAARAMEGNGVVTIQVHPGYDRVQIVVRDHGPGIPVDMQQNLFRTWSRGKKANGTGMGLSIVRAFVIEEGGEIHYDTSYQDGAGFILELPLIKAKG